MEGRKRAERCLFKKKIYIHIRASPSRLYDSPTIRSVRIGTAIVLACRFGRFSLVFFKYSSGGRIPRRGNAKIALPDDCVSERNRIVVPVGSIGLLFYLISKTFTDDFLRGQNRRGTKARGTGYLTVF